MNNELKSPGIPVIDILTLTTVLDDKIDLRSQLVSFIISEDIFAPVLTGEITIIDNNNLFDHIPISGNETLNIKFHSYGFTSDNKIDFIDKTFDILKIVNISQDTDYAKKYTLIFASQELKKNETIKISKSFFNKTISEIISEIIISDYEEDNGLGFSDQEKLFIEKTKYKEPCITIPYMKPFDIIKWLSSRAIRMNSSVEKKDNIAANFLFFENKNGYQFVSLNTLFEQKENPEKSLFVYGMAKQNLNREWTINNIETLKIENCYDILGNIKNGLFSSKLITYNVSNGETIDNNYDYIEKFEQNESINKNGNPIIYDTNITKKSNAKRMLLPIITRENDNITGTTSQRFSENKDLIGSEEYLQSRISQLSKLIDFRILIEISGNSKHKVGDIVNLDLQMWEYSSDTDKTKLENAPNKYYSGNYLITNIKHIISNTQYVMYIELVKDNLSAKIGK